MIYRLTKAQIIALLIAMLFIIFIIYKLNPSHKKLIVNDESYFAITSDSLHRQINKQQELIVYTDSCNKLLIIQIDSLRDIIVTKQNEIKLLNKKRNYVKDFDYSKFSNSDITKFLSKRYNIK
jgi:hypothetical protein